MAATTIKSPAVPGTFPVKFFPVRFEQEAEPFSEEVPIQKAETAASQRVGEEFLPTPEQIAEIRSYGKEPPKGLTYSEAQKLIAKCKKIHNFKLWSESPIDGMSPLKLPVSGDNQKPPIDRRFPPAAAAPVFIPPTPEQFAEVRSFGKEPPKGLTFQEARTWIEQLKIFFAPKTGQLPPEPQTVERNDWRTAPASEKQKEKLRLLGCTFDDGITVGIAKLLIERHKAESEISHPSVRREGFFSGESQPETRKTEAASCQSTKEWEEWFALQERIKKRSIPFDELPAQEVTIQEAETVAIPSAARSEVGNSAPVTIVKEPEPPLYLEYPHEPRPDSFAGLSFDRAYLAWKIEFPYTEEKNRQLYKEYVAEMERWNSQRSGGAIKQPEPFPEPPGQPEPPAEQFGEQIKNYDWHTAHAAAMQKEELRLQDKSTASKWSSFFEA